MGQLCLLYPQGIGIGTAWHRFPGFEKEVKKKEVVQIYSLIIESTTEA